MMTTPRCSIISMASCHPLLNDIRDATAHRADSQTLFLACSLLAMAMMILAAAAFEQASPIAGIMSGLCTHGAAVVLMPQRVLHVALPQS